MPRRPRIHTVVPGLPHHFIARGNNRRVLFSYPRCRYRYLGYLADAAKRFGILVHAFVLMTNHVHLVVFVPSALALARFAHSVHGRYSLWRNRERGGSGKLFEARYDAIPIESERQLAATTAYLELNAVAAGIVADPADWIWSSYALHAGLPPRAELLESIWTPTDWWLGLSSDPDLRSARYRELVRARAGRLDDVVLPESVEERLHQPYSQRLLRPDGSRASEAVCTFRARSSMFSRG